MDAPHTSSLTIPKADGQLEGILQLPEGGPPDRLAVLCHPHPEYGGTMHNKVVYYAARTLREAGFGVLRFNFRGVGRSTGSFAHGEGEQEDVRAALDYLAGRFPMRDVWVAGYSFGAWVGLRVGCADPRVSTLVGIGIPTKTAEFSFLRDCRKPVLLVQGSQDEFGDPAALQSLYEAAPGPKALAWIEGADHFFEGRLDEVTAALASFVRARIEGDP
ncbi:MAG: alpha/beta fold hydrolase [Deltaproteobacteria bacterium]|nr:alpha/beta fold hydrolase [Deltaproteobacteria bacterium]